MSESIFFFFQFYYRIYNPFLYLRPSWVKCYTVVSLAARNHDLKMISERKIILVEWFLNIRTHYEYASRKVLFKRVANFTHFSAFLVKMYLKFSKIVYIIVVLMDMSNVDFILRVIRMYVVMRLIFHTHVCI